MQKKLTITIDEEVYKGLHAVIGRGRISRFLEDLARPYVVSRDLEVAYRGMAGDQVREAEADKWAEGLIGDLPGTLQQRLKKRAKANRRSVSKEALVILEKALGHGTRPPSIEEIDKLRVRGARPLTQEILDEARGSGRP